MAKTADCLRLFPSVPMEKMIDRSFQGLRCRASDILRLQDDVRPLTEGAIEYELETDGRVLLKVFWDTGVSSFIAPDEVEIIDPDLVWQ